MSGGEVGGPCERRGARFAFFRDGWTKKLWRPRCPCVGARCGGRRPAFSLLSMTRRGPAENVPRRCGALRRSRNGSEWNSVGRTPVGRRHVDTSGPAPLRPTIPPPRDPPGRFREFDPEPVAHSPRGRRTFRFRTECTVVPPITFFGTPKRPVHLTITRTINYIPSLLYWY